MRAPPSQQQGSTLSLTPVHLEQIQVRFSTFRADGPQARQRRADEARSITADGAVLIETCHRVELVTVGAAGPPAADVAGREAVRRVFEVVAGFDSAVIAEEQLLGQVRLAYERARASHRTGPVLDELFQRSLRFGRRVRAHALPGADRSLADRAVQWLIDRVPRPVPVVVVGTGEMGRLAAIRLAEGGHAVHVSSRSEERGRRVASVLPGAGHGLRVGPLTADDLAPAGGVVLAVRTRAPMLTASLLTEAGLPYVADLSLPPAVAPDAASILGERLRTVDQLADPALAAPVLHPRAERRLRGELDREVDGFVEWFATRRSSGALATLHAEAHAIRRRHLDKLRRGGTLSPEQLQAVEAVASAMMGEFLHRPSMALRSGGASADAVRQLFGLEARGQ